VDGDGVVVGVEHDDFEQASSGISADHQHPVHALPHEADWDRDRGPDVLVSDSMPPSTLSNLHRDRVPCQGLAPEPYLWLSCPVVDDLVAPVNRLPAVVWRS